MKKVLILGCKGMAGHVIKTYLESLETYDIWGLARDVKHENNIINLDVSNTKELEHIINKGSFEVVINCIGLLNNTAENNPELAVWFNSYFPQLLATFGKKYNFKLIHISTDCVFSGEKGNYIENSFKDGIGFYAQSKALGEVVNQKDLTLRTSIIGPELNENGIGLFHWFMNQKKEVNGYTNAIWSGVTTLVLAKTVGWAIENHITGLYHVTNNKSIDKFSLLCLINKHTKKNIIIHKFINKESNKSFIDTRKELNFIIPNYEEMIKEMIDYILNNKVLYKQYIF